ncbi:MAG: hypothetical protein MUF64_10755, partial [Polyangiaceae bacterium]|nr:hypothetical protein [Polyangiaceae bacterium]
PSSGVNPAVSDPSRQAMVHFARACQPRLHGAAFVVRFDGFLGATVRSVLAAAIMVARPSIPVKLHATIPEALLWLGRSTPQKLPPAPLVLERAGRLATLLGSSLA